MTYQLKNYFYPSLISLCLWNSLPESIISLSLLKLKSFYNCKISKYSAIVHFFKKWKKNRHIRCIQYWQPQFDNKQMESPINQPCIAPSMHCHRVENKSLQDNYTIEVPAPLAPTIGTSTTGTSTTGTSTTGTSTTGSSTTAVPYACKACITSTKSSSSTTNLKAAAHQ